MPPTFVTFNPAPPQSALGMMQMLEDTLIEHAHTKPLLPSQLIRYREVQVPDGEYHTHAHSDSTSLSSSSFDCHRPLLCWRSPALRNTWLNISFNIPPPPWEEQNKWKVTSLGPSHKHLLFSLWDKREPEHLRSLLIVLGNSKGWREGKSERRGRYPETPCISQRDFSGRAPACCSRHSALLERKVERM